MPRLRDWLSRPHVVPWWGAPGEALAEARQRAADAHAVIVANGVAVGYICWGTPSEGELEAAGLTGLPDGLVDVDMLLGEPEVLGQGIGPRAGVLLLDRLRATGQASCVGVGMSASNKRAIRAAEKVGFRLFGEFDDPESGSGQYMILEMPSS